MKRSYWILPFIAPALFFAFSSGASTPIRFALTELAALLTLAKPDQSQFRLDGTRGVLTPGPTLAFLGLEELDFDVSLGGSKNIANLRFNDLRAKSVTLGFEPGRMKLEIFIVDKEKAIRSALGAVHLRGVSIAAWFKISETSSGAVTLAIDDFRLLGDLRGTGVFTPKFILKEIRGRVESKSREKIGDLLAKPNVQAGVENALVKWAQFSVNRLLARVVTGTPELTEAGISFDAE